MARVVVVIPTWNGRELLAGALATLGAQDFGDFRVVVVDNGSDDGTADWLSASHPDVEVVGLPRNVGFAPAVNAGIAAARDAEYVALLNNDMEVAPRWLGELVAALDAHPDAGSATSKLLIASSPELLDGAGDLVTWYAATWRRGHGEADRGQYDTPGEIASACAGAALYRRAALDDVGGFEESFFAYLEDTDWGLRAQLRGWACRWVPSSVAVHLGGATSRRMGDLETRLVTRNALALALRCFPARRLAAWAPVVVAFQLYALVMALREGRARAVLGGWREAAARLPATLQARRAIQSRRCVPLERLDAVVQRGILRRRR